MCKRNSPNKKYLKKQKERKEKTNQQKTAWDV